jgi:murein DD-endopeptidase MepM/ murein hydrolase activator NlpD
MRKTIDTTTATKAIETTVTALTVSRRLRMGIVAAAAGVGLVAVPFVAAATEGNAPSNAPAVAQQTSHPVALGETAAAKHVATVANRQAVTQVRTVANTAKSWVRPVDGGRKTASFNQGGARWSHKHSGQDFAVPVGTPVKSVASGTVVTAGWGGAYGNNIVIRHANGKYSQYAHLSKFNAKVGERVSAGEVIARSGNTGNSSGPHLHFEIRNKPVYGYAINPVNYLRSHGVHV